jgi:preprotein translocase subunit Sec61beta
MIAMSEPRKATPLQVIKAVLWSFLGIRRSSEHEADAVRLKPSQVIVAGIVIAAIFVLTLIAIVRIVIGSAT